MTMITLVSYNPQWPVLFNEEKLKLAHALGDITSHIEHIGSTAIPTIQAKPVIDIMIGVNNISQFTAGHIAQLAALGYQYNATLETEFPFRRFFQKSDQLGNRTYQIHIVNYVSSWWQKHVLFRNFLLKSPVHAKQYEAYKLMLAPQFNDTVSYAVAKNACCEQINQLAFYDFELNHAFIETQRSKAYLPQLACLDDYIHMLTDAKVIACYGVAFSQDKAKQILISDISHWDQHGFGPWMWYDATNQAYIGRAGIKACEINGKEEVKLDYAITPGYWGQGISVEISQAAIDFAFSKLEIASLICFTLPTNHQSLRVMEKLGFNYEQDFVYAGLPHKLYRLEK